MLNYKQTDRPAITESKNMELYKAVHSAQHCQRNFDLSKKMPTEDIKTLVTAATQSPSKQNIAFYKLHVITNRDVIDEIYEACSGTGFDGETTPSNPQVLANLVFVFEEYANYDNSGPNRNPETKRADEDWAKAALNNDRNQAIGVAAGMVNLSAAQLGYGTGCCACILDMPRLKKAIGAKNGALLVMGIGYRDTTKNRTVHHLHDNVLFKTRKKQAVPLNYMK